MRIWLRAAIMVFPWLLMVSGSGKELRVVSLSPALTEIVFQLGRGDWLVGRTTACRYPEAVKEVPAIGDFGNPLLEKLIAARPDLVLTGALMNPRLRHSFDSLGIKSASLDTKSIADYLANLVELGKLLDCEEVAAEEVARMKKGLDEFSAKYRELSQEQRPKVMIVVWDNPLMTCGSKSFLNDCINYAGGRNIAASVDADYFYCSLEWMVREKPEVIIFPAIKASRRDELKRNRTWMTLPAVVNDRFYCDIDENLFFIPGPRLLEAIAVMEQCIHP